MHITPTASCPASHRRALPTLLAAVLALSLGTGAQAADATAQPQAQAASKAKPARKMTRKHVECVAANNPAGKTGDGSNIPSVKKPSGPKCPEGMVPKAMKSQ